MSVWVTCECMEWSGARKNRVGQATKHHFEFQIVTYFFIHSLFYFFSVVIVVVGVCVCVCVFLHLLRYGIYMIWYDMMWCFHGTIFSFRVFVLFVVFFRNICVISIFLVLLFFSSPSMSRMKWSEVFAMLKQSPPRLPLHSHDRHHHHH